MLFNKWEDLVENKREDLEGFCSIEMTFTSMDKGTLHYKGKYKGADVYCSAAECSVSDYDYAAKETVASVTQGEYVYLTLDGEVILNTH